MEKLRDGMNRPIPVVPATSIAAAVAAPTVSDSLGLPKFIPLADLEIGQAYELEARNLPEAFGMERSSMASDTSLVSCSWTQRFTGTSTITAVPHKRSVYWSNHKGEDHGATYGHDTHSSVNRGYTT